MTWCQTTFSTNNGLPKIGWDGNNAETKRLNLWNASWQARKAKKHHFIAKSQAQFMKDKKKSLEVDECIVFADFSENYSFIVRDEVQGHYWVNKQATIHPFVFYKEGN